MPQAVWWLLALATAVVSLLATRASIRYAHRRRLFDQPGQRRSHSLPTPRGGGIAIVLAVVLSMLALVEIRNGVAGMLASMPL
ncbi:MAG: glycosyl transferase family 4, partial [Xanthomonadales bacterium]|nr:glycosyl transferase family 4 [Xanthomonadales bacterium]